MPRRNPPIETTETEARMPQRLTRVRVLFRSLRVLGPEAIGPS